MSSLLHKATSIDEDDNPLLHPGLMIRKLRIRKGLSQTALANELGIGRRTLYNWEHELARIDFVDVIVALTNHLDQDVNIGEWTYPRR